MKKNKFKDDFKRNGRFQKNFNFINKQNLDGKLLEIRRNSILDINKIKLDLEEELRGGKSCYFNFIDYLEIIKQLLDKNVTIIIGQKEFFKTISEDIIKYLSQNNISYKVIKNSSLVTEKFTSKNFFTITDKVQRDTEILLTITDVDLNSIKKIRVNQLIMINTSKILDNFDFYQIYKTDQYIYTLELEPSIDKNLKNRRLDLFSEFITSLKNYDSYVILPEDLEINENCFEIKKYLNLFNKDKKTEQIDYSDLSNQKEFIQSYENSPKLIRTNNLNSVNLLLKLFSKLKNVPKDMFYKEHDEFKKVDNSGAIFKEKMLVLVDLTPSSTINTIRLMRNFNLKVYHFSTSYEKDEVKNTINFMRMGMADIPILYDNLDLLEKYTNTVFELK